MPLTWSKIRKGLLVVAAVVAGGALLLFGLVCLLLILVSSGDPNREQVIAPTAHRTTELYLRNRTAAPLLLSLRVPRTHLTLDTAWWGLETDAAAVGQAVVVRGSAADVLRPWLRRPVLLAGSADTLVAAAYPGDPSLRHPGPHRRFEPGRNLDLWGKRLRQALPVFAEAVRAEPLPGQPDTLRLTVAVAPDSSFLLLRHTEGFYPAEFYPDGASVAGYFEPDPTLPRFLLRPTVRWQDGRPRPPQQMLPLAQWLRMSAGPENQLPAENQQRVQYLDFR